MLGWIANNMGTILVAAVLIGIVCAILIKMRGDRKNHTSSCGCGCAHCAMSDFCHKNK